MAIKPSDPVGTDALERSAMRDFSRIMNRIKKEYIDQIDLMKPYEFMRVNEYRYDLNAGILKAIFDHMDRFIDALLVGFQGDNWFLNRYVETSYERGTRYEYANIAKQSAVYKAGTRSITDRLTAQAYASRIALVRARSFEQMKGLSATTKSTLAEVLSNGIANGHNPRDVAKAISAQTDINKRRANRIARTEVSTALRRARWDEIAQAKDDFGIEMKLMHLSALSPTTRASHSARHGKTYTEQEVREWYSKDANSINCFLPGTRVCGRFHAGARSHYAGPIVSITLQNGNRLRVTPDHNVFTPYGMRPARDLDLGDFVCVVNNAPEGVPIEAVFDALTAKGTTRGANMPGMVSTLAVESPRQIFSGDMRVFRWLKWCGRLMWFTPTQRIASISISQYEGFVYDLESDSKKLLSSGIITSNCKCSQVGVMVDDDGQPINKKLIERTKAAYQRYKARDDD